MIIPVRCPTCGKLIGAKYLYFKEYMDKNKKNEDNHLEYFNTEEGEDRNITKSVAGELLDFLDVNDMCCRIRFLTHVDVI